MFIPHYFAKWDDGAKKLHVVEPIGYTMWRRNHYEDKDTLIAICGETGSRKSGSAISLAMSLDVIPYTSKPDLNEFWSPLMKDKRAIRPHQHPNHPQYLTRFSLSKLFYKISDLVKIINAEPSVARYSALVFDEIGVDVDARDFMTMKNKLINHVFRTLRYRNLYVIVTTPTLKDFDVGLKRNLKAYIEMNENFVHPKKALSKFMWAQTNPKTGKTYLKKQRWALRDGTRIIIDRYFIPRPPPWIERSYKRWKHEAAMDLYKSMDSEIQRAEEFLRQDGKRVRQEGKSLKDYRKEVLDKKEGCIDKRTGNFSASLIAFELDISVWMAKAVASGLNAEKEREESEE